LKPFELRISIQTRVTGGNGRVRKQKAKAGEKKKRKKVQKIATKFQKNRVDILLSKLQRNHPHIFFQTHQNREPIKLNVQDVKQEEKSGRPPPNRKNKMDGDLGPSAKRPRTQ